MPLILLLLAACGGAGNCAKVLCGADQYCLADYTQEADSADPFAYVPECTEFPEDCGLFPSCDCLPECTSCSVEQGLVHCTIE